MKRIITIFFLLFSIASFGQGAFQIDGRFAPTGSYPITRFGEAQTSVWPVVRFTQRDSIPTWQRTYGMIVYAADRDSCYQLKSAVLDNTNWFAFKLGNTYSYTLPAATNTTLGGIITGANITNTAGTISFTNSNVVSALGFTPYNSTNPNSYISSAALSTLTDAVVATPTNGQLLQYNSISGKWNNWTPNYLTSYNETDPIFIASAAHSIAGTDITNWNGKVNYTDTASMLNSYKTSIIALNADTATIQPRLNNVLSVANSKQVAYPNLTSIGSLTNGAGVLVNNGTGTFSYTTTPTLTGTNFSGIPNGALTNSSITINGSSVSLGGSTTVTATATNALTIGTGLSGTSYNGSAAVTIANTGVLSNVAGTGISVSGSTGNVTITNTGVTSLTGGTDMTVSASTGGVTVNNTSTLASITSRGNTTSTGISLTQNGNTSTSYAIYGKRNTDTSPLGYLIQFQNTAANTNLFTVDVSGNVVGTSFSGSGSGLTGTASSLTAGNATTWNGNNYVGARSVTSSDFFLTNQTGTPNWGYTSVSSVQAALGLGSAAYQPMTEFIGSYSRGGENKDFNQNLTQGTYDIYMGDNGGAGWSNYPAGTNVYYGGLSVIKSQYNVMQLFSMTTNDLYYRELYAPSSGVTSSWRKVIFADVLGSNAYTSTAYQPLATNLTSLAGLSYVSGAYFVKMTAAGTFALDNSAYFKTSSYGSALSNINSAVQEGSNFWNSSTINKPTSGYGSVLSVDGYHGGDGTGWNNQIGFGTDNNVYFRQSIGNNTSWTSWRSFVFADQLGSNAYTSTAYLPLTGGTLTGALTGTSATFTNSVTASSFIGSLNYTLTLGTDLSGTSFNNSGNVTVNNTSTLATVTGRGNSTSTGIQLTQNGNLSSSYAIYGKRNTDTSPLGYLIQFQNTAANTNLFTVDVSGNINSGTITATSGVFGTSGIGIQGSSSDHSYLYQNPSHASTSDLFYFPRYSVDTLVSQQDLIPYLKNAVTSITAGNGLSGGTITSTGTIAVDTSVISTKWNVSNSSVVTGYYNPTVHVDSINATLLAIDSLVYIINGTSQRGTVTVSGKIKMNIAAVGSFYYVFGLPNYISTNAVITHGGGSATSNSNSLSAAILVSSISNNKLQIAGSAGAALTNEFFYFTSTFSYFVP